MNEYINRVICGDCATVLQSLPSNYVDLFLTSPPYDKARKYNGYNFDFDMIAKQIYRTTAIGGTLVWIINDQTKNGSESGTSFEHVLYFKEIGFKLNDTMIWVKTNYQPQNHGVRYEGSFEYMFVLTKGRPKTANILREPTKNAGRVSVGGVHRYQDGNKTNVDRSRRKKNIEAGIKVKDTKPRSNVWHYPVSQKKTFHPAPFPYQLARDHILSWSNEGDLVVDPMMGSGTTLLQAEKLNRRYLGIDMSSEYCVEVEKLLSYQMK